LRQCFDNYLGEDSIWAWDDKEISELKFLKGCFLMMTSGSKTEAAKCWVEAYNLNPAANHFVSVYHQSKRFAWSSKDFNFLLCKDVISYALDKGGLDCEELETITKVSEGILKGLQILEGDRRNYGRNLRQNQNKTRSSESDESSWRSNKNRNRGGRHSFSSELENLPLGPRNEFRTNNNGTTNPFQRNRTTSGSEDANWRQ